MTAVADRFAVRVMVTDAWDQVFLAVGPETTVAELKQMPEWVEGGQQTATGSSLPPRDLSNKPSDNTKNPPSGAGDTSR